MGGLGDLIRRLFAGRQPLVRPPESRGCDVLQFIGARQLVVAWASGRQDGLGSLWEACPRADWLIDIAHRSGLPLERVARTVRALPLELGAGAWSTIDALLDDLTAALDQAVDGDPDYVDLRQRMPRADYNDAYDHAAREQLERRHRELHEQHTRIVRESIPYRDVRAALYGEIAGPYR
jgi:hypothetical protein